MPVKPKSAVKSKATAKPDTINLSRKNDLAQLSEDIISHVGVGIYIAQQGKFVYVSPLFQSLAGYSHADLLGTNPLNYVYPEDREITRKLAIQHLKGKSSDAYEYRFIRKNDEIIWVLEKVTSISYKGKRAALGSFMDITGRKHIEETLRQSEEKYRTILENMQEGYFELDLAGNFTFVNNASCRHLGYTKEEMIGTKSKHYQDETTAKKMFQLFTDLYRTGEPIMATEAVWIRKDGTKGSYEMSASLIRDSKGKPIGFRGISRNITERKRTEEALRRSEEKYRTILEDMEEGYFETDLAGNFTFINDVECKNLGYSREELLGMNNRQYTNAENAKKVYQAFSNLYKTGQSCKIFDYEVTKKDGSKAINELLVSLMRDSQGKPIGFRGLSRHITERKQMENTLRQSEEKYRSILENIRESYFEVDLVGNFTFFNESLCRLTRCSKEELLGTNYSKFSNEENSKIVFHTFNKVYKTGKPAEGFDWPTIRKDGFKGFVEASISLRKDSAGNPIGFRGVLRDVTDRKRMEETLRQSEGKFRNILESIEEGYFELDLAGHYTFVNDANCRFLGYTRKEMIGMNSRRHSSSEENFKKLQQSYTRLYQTGEPIKSLEFESSRKDGTKVTYETSVTLRRDSEGKPIGFRGVSRDITERKLMEETLRRSEERYRTILEEMEDAYFEVDIAGNFTFVNDAISHLLGYSKEELLGKTFRDQVNQEDIKTVYNAFGNIFRTGKPERGIFYRIIRNDGTTGFAEVAGFPIQNQTGEIIGFRGIGRDITERKKEEEALRHSEEKYRTIIESIEDGYYEIDLSGNFTLVNDVICQQLGYTREELIGFNNRQYTDEKTAKEIHKLYVGIYNTGKPIKGHVFERINKNGAKGFSEVSVSLIRDSKGNPVGFRGIARDVSERKQMEESIRQSEERYRTIIEEMEEWYFETDLAGNIIFFNDIFTRGLGYSQKELTGLNFRAFVKQEQADTAYKTFHQVFETGEPIKNFPYEFVQSDGSITFAELSIFPKRDQEGKIFGFRGVGHDITERKRAEERIQYLATHDGLTDLPNRVMFSQLLNHAIQAAHRYKRQFAVFFIDLDRFKIINDTLGHEAGDHLLKEIAMRFRQALRAVDIVARLGGDEFAILIEEVNDLDQVATVAHKILSTAMNPMSLVGEECRVTASIGISTYPKDGEDEQTLMKRADIAMYFAKEEGKNNFQFFSPDIKSGSIERLSIETNLRFALERNELALAYQAKLDFKTGAITGVEALLRWNNPTLGSVTPVQFIPVAEESGLIVPIGRWVLRTACAQNTAWQRQGLPPICMAVNLSLRQLLDANLLDDIEKALKDSGMAPKLLELEMTESMVMHSPTRMIAVLAKIKNMGVRLAIDDFGTGYSSLAQIKHFPIDTLKVDRSFIRNIPEDAEDKAITEAIIAMGRTLSLTVVAEGVETQEQMDFLRGHSCDEMQGFYFSKPIAPELFADLLRTHVPSSQKKS